MRSGDAAVVHLLNVVSEMYLLDPLLGLCKSVAGALTMWSNRWHTRIQSSNAQELCKYTQRFSAEGLKSIKAAIGEGGLCFSGTMNGGIRPQSKCANHCANYCLGEDTPPMHSPWKGPPFVLVQLKQMLGQKWEMGVQQALMMDESSMRVQ